MTAQNLAFLSFNRGLISRLGLARLDLPRTRLSAEVMTNWLPRVLGSMSIRVGWQFLASTASDNAARYLPFIFSTTDVALVELTNLLMRVWISDTLMTRGSVTSAVANGNFDTNLTSWTDNDEAGGTSVWVTGGYMGLTGNGTAAAIRDQTVTVAVGDQNDEHALRIVIQRGPVTLRVGTGTTDDSYINETELQTGTHSLAFTPTGNFNIRFLSRYKRQVQIDSCNVEASGIVTIPTPWVTADLGIVRYDQSGDVIFCAAFGYTQRRIERRATRSWSVVQYITNDGPFRVENSGPITLTAGALSGNTTLTASAAFFRSTNAPTSTTAGSLFRVSSNGQRVTAAVTAANQFTSAIRVTGTSTTRNFTVIRAGTWVATVTLQRSLESDIGPWVDVTTYTNNGTVTFADGLDNQIAWYRIGVKTAEFTSGTADLELNYSGGSIDGICRVTAFTSSTVVDVEVIVDFGATTAASFWSEGEWSDRRGWPSALRFHEGRLWFCGKDRNQGSVSDDFHSFDDTVEGDSGPISRSIGSGPVDNLNWMLSLQRLILGGQGAEYSVKSSSLDEPVTPTSYNLKATTTNGSAAVEPIKNDAAGIFVHKNQTKVFELSIANDRAAIDYGGVDLTQLVPEIGEPSITRTAIQRQPDVRCHFVRSDGDVAVMIIDRTENVLCWCEIDTDGSVEDVVVLPGTTEDSVYYVVNRTINAVTRRYLEKWALTSQTLGGNVTRLADSFLIYSGAATTIITGLTHLEGERVVVWGDGVDQGTTDAFLALPGTAGNYARTPDAAALDVIGDIDLRAKIAPTNWSALQSVIAKFTTTGNQRSYELSIQASGVLRLSWSTSGVTALTADSTAATAFPANAIRWIRATMDVDDASGNRVIKFYTSTDGVVWTQLGTTITTAGTTSIFSSTAVLELGSITAGTAELFTGRIYYAEVRDGIDGTTVAKFNPTTHVVGDATFVGGGTSETWTMLGTAEITNQLYSVSGAQIVIDTAVSNACVGLPYRAQWKASKLGIQAALGASLTMPKRVTGLGLMLADIHPQGLFYGSDFVNMDPMPIVRRGVAVNQNTVVTDLDDTPTNFPSEWDSDSRICLEGRAPRPVTVVGMVGMVEMHEEA